MSAADIYGRIKRDVDKLQLAGAEHREWAKMSATILEGVMQCQAIVMEKQRLAAEAARTNADPAHAAELRRDARDALYYVEALTKLYEQVRTR